MSYRGEPIILTNDSGRYFAEGMAKYSGIRLGDSEDRYFGNTEGKSIILENVRGKDVYIVQCVRDLESDRSINDNFMYSIFLTESAKRSGAAHVTNVLPLYPYERQDARFKVKTGQVKHQREGITAATVARFYQSVGSDGLITISAHSRQIAGFIDPWMVYEDLSFRPIIVKYVVKNIPDIIENLLIGSPDPGGAGRADSVTDRFIELDFGKIYDMAIGLKERDHTTENVIKKTVLIGDVNGKNLFTIDDVLDTVSTIGNFSRIAKKEGAEKIYIAGTHGTFSDPAYDVLTSLYDDDIIAGAIVSNSVNIGKKFRDLPFLTEIDVTDIFGKAILGMNKNESISDLSK